MLTVAQRPMAPEERAIVTRWEKPARARAMDWGCAGYPLLCALLGAVPGVLLAYLMLYMLSGGHTAHWLRPALLLGVLLGAGIGIAYAAVFGHRTRLFRQGYTAELAIGQVEVWQCTAMRAVRVESPEEGTLPGYLLQVDTRQLLFLDSFHLAELAGDESFPCRRFDVILLPETTQVVRVLCLEGGFAPECIYQIDSAQETLPQLPVVLSGDLDHLDGVLRG